MAQFLSVHEELVIEDIRFRKGIYTTDDPREISLLSKSRLQDRYGIRRIDSDVKPESVEEAPKAKSKITAYKK